MATIYKRLSKRVQADTDLTEVLLRLRNGKDYDLNAKSGIFVTPDNFRNGEIIVNRRKVGNDVQYHEKQRKKMDSLCAFVLQQVTDTQKEYINADWFKLQIDKFNHPDKYQPKAPEKKSVYQLIEEYLSKKQFSYDHTKAIRVLERDIARFSFDVDTITKADIEDFLDYLRNEYELSKEYPKQFEKLLTANPVGIGRGIQKLEVRGENTIIKLTKKLKAFFVWLNDTDKTSNRPFEGIEIGTEKFGTPYYISIAERNLIADTDLKAKFESLDKDAQKAMLSNCHCQFNTLEQQRDIFVFQCFIGCRVGDLVKLTDKNIVNELVNGQEIKLLVYTPHKTKDESEVVQARIPFITPQRYNGAIKAVFTLSGITRSVEVRNPKTGETEIKPINEIASSHLARRTFVGNAYFKVSDPNIIGKMSGHVDGSRAFKRYRKIEDTTLQNVINQIG